MTDPIEWLGCVAINSIEAQEKELAALRERVSYYEKAYDGLIDKQSSVCRRLEARAETAERERDEAREALKPFALAADKFDATWFDHETHWSSTNLIMVGHLRAARAITGEKP